MKEESNKIFISYSWTTKKHEDWVEELAIRLRENGIDVRLDKWDLKDGNNVYEFMESMVKSDEINKVLIICDKGYKIKADEKKGGVGTETQIITPEIYNNVKQEKFIPIIAERDDDGKAQIPILLKSLKYIDMSNDENYENGFEQLLRNLYNRPLHRKPELGKAPAWLYEDETEHSKTRNAVRSLQTAIKDNKRIEFNSTQFVDDFLQQLDVYLIDSIDPGIEFDDVVAKMIEDMKPLRDDYVDYLENLCSVDEGFDIDVIAELFERMYPLTKHRNGMKSSFHYQFDNYKFFIHELFIYTFAVLLRFKKYDYIGYLTSRVYFLKSDVDLKSRKDDFTVFRQYLRSLDEKRNQRLGLKKLSVTAETLVQRADNSSYSKLKIVEADIMLYYLSIYHGEDINYGWFPCTYVYGIEGQTFSIFEKLVSTRHFNKVKGMFSVNSVNELKERFTEIDKAKEIRYQRGFESVPSIGYHIDIEEIGSTS